jgi:hypothetical protein
MKYLCLGYYDDRKFAAMAPDEMAALVEKCRTHDEALRKSGKLLMVASLDAPGQAAALRPRNGAVSMTDGPYAEAKEVIGSFFVIEAKDREEALRVASLHPAARMGEQLSWGVEVRGIDFFDQL